MKLTATPLNIALTGFICFALWLPVRGQGVVEVETAEELQIALEEGSRHIRVTKHLNTAGLAPQKQWEASNVTYALIFLVESETRSVTGACMGEPEASVGIEGYWKPGMCLVHVPEHSGFYAENHAGILWLHQLYILVSDTQTTRATASFREAVRAWGDSVAMSLYLTDLALETRPDYSDTAEELTALEIMMEADAQMQVLLAEVALVGNDVSTHNWTSTVRALAAFGAQVGEITPRNASVSLLYSRFVSLYAPRWRLVYFSTDLRVERCSFTARPQVWDETLGFDGRGIEARTLYADDASLDVGSYPNGTTVKRRALAQSGRDQRLAQGKLPFLTLDDPAFLALQAEVSPFPPTPPPPPSPPPPPPAVTVDVSTAEELQAALEAKSRHVRVVDHIDTAATPPQRLYENGEEVMFEVPVQTASITGACQTAPEADHSASWTPGVCMLQLPRGNGFRVHEHAQQALWLHSLFLLVTGDQPVDLTRYAIYIDGSQISTQIYITRLVVEVRPSHHNGVDDIRALAIFNEDGSLQVLTAGSTFVANDESIDAEQQEEAFNNLVYFGSQASEPTPRNSTMSLLNSNITSRYALRNTLVYFAGDLRVENCSFSARPVTTIGDLTFDGRFGTGQRSLYSDGPSLNLAHDTDGPAARERPLAESSRTQSLAEGALPFLTLDDEGLLALQAEVASALPVHQPPPPAPPRLPAPPPRPPPPLPPSLPPDVWLASGSESRSTDDASDETPIGAIVGSVLGGLVVLVGATTAILVMHRQGTLCWPREATPEANLPDIRLAAISAGSNLAATPAVVGNALDISRESCIVTERHDPIAQALIAQSTVTQTTSSGDDALHMRPQTQPMRSDWATMDPSTVTETLGRATYVGTMTAGRAGVDLGKEDQVQVLEEVLDRLHRAGLKLGNRWTVLSANQRRVGGQGLVQFVRDEVREEYCAVKFFFEDATFEREAELYARPSVRDMMAAVVHMEPAGGPCPGLGSMPAWIVLERGSSLTDWALAQRPDLLTSAQVLSQVLQRLERLHEHGLVHRDIKPANILWRDAAKAWTLIDFGCVVDTRDSKEATLSFSLPYAAPEVIHALEHNHRTMPIHTSLDIWSIGVVVYELLMMARLFPLGCTAEDMKDQLAGRVPLPWERVAPDDRWATFAKLGMLQDAVLACLSRAPEARPSAQELLHTLQDPFSRRATDGSVHK